MKKIFVGLLIVLTFVLLGILVFNTEFASVDSLIRPPKIEGENYEIQAAFEAAVGEKYILKSPLSGEYRTSFIQTDIDNDGEKEVVVFYCYPDAVDVVRMNILDEDMGIWKSLADLESTYNDIYQIQFADVDNDNTKELIVCWRNFEAEISNKLDVYKISDIESGGIKSIFSKNYYKFLICDVNGDLQIDIITFEKNSSGTFNEISGTYYGFVNGEPNTVGEFTVDHAITSIGEVCSDREAETGNLRIYIDGYKTDSGMTTDIVCWDNAGKHFQKLSLENSTAVSVVASRNVNINCKDIDNDSRINIPLEDYIPESTVIYADSTEGLQHQTVLKWVEHNGTDFDLINYEILNSKYGYSLVIEPEHYGKFTVENDNVNGTMTFYELFFEEIPRKDKKPKKKDEPFDDFEPAKEDVEVVYRKGEALFTILTTNEVDYGIYEFSGYKHITAAHGFNYYCQITDAGKKYAITKETIKAMFIT